MNYPLTWLDRRLHEMGGDRAFASSRIPRLVYDEALHEELAGQLPLQKKLPWGAFVVGGQRDGCVVLSGKYMDALLARSGVDVSGVGTHWCAGSWYMRDQPTLELGWVIGDAAGPDKYRMAVFPISPEAPLLDGGSPFIKAAGGLIASAVGFSEMIAVGAGGAVAVSVTEPGRVRELKPWLNRTWESYVGVTMRTAAQRHGMPRGPVDERHAPIPHHRRGHFAELRAARYGANIGKKVWRKPAWVGPVEWAHAGQIYRVVDSGALGGPGSP